MEIDNRQSKGKIIKKIIFHDIPIEVKTPLRISSGIDDGITDILVLRNKKGYPFIPATSIAGVLRSLIRDIYGDNGRFVENLIFGNISDENGINEGNQSLINISDINFDFDKFDLNKYIAHRDGIKINKITGISENKAKYDFEVLERGLVGNLDIEITVRRDLINVPKNFVPIHKSLDIYEDVAASIADLFVYGISIGALITKGLGKIQVQDKKIIKYYIFDFSTKHGFKRWIDFIDRGAFNDFGKSDIYEGNKLNIENVISNNEGYFNLEADFKIKNTLIVRNYDLRETDKKNKLKIQATQMKSNKDYVIPGTSIKGTIRNRAYHILRQLNYDEKEIILFINNLMGYDGSDKTKSNRSRFYIDEVYLSEDEVGILQQTRNRIDRFTGGTISGALFAEKAIYQKHEENVPIKIKIRIKKDIKSSEEYFKAEIGLVLLIIRDLWLGILPIGGGKNIGRGVLKGKQCSLDSDLFGDISKICIVNQKDDKQQFIVEDENIRKRLNGFVKILSEKRYNINE